MFAFWIPLILSFYYLSVKPMFAQEINHVWPKNRAHVCSKINRVWPKS